MPKNTQKYLSKFALILFIWNLHRSNFPDPAYKGLDVLIVAIMGMFYCALGND